MSSNFLTVATSVIVVLFFSLSSCAENNPAFYSSRVLVIEVGTRVDKLPLAYFKTSIGDEVKITSIHMSYTDGEPAHDLAVKSAVKLPSDQLLSLSAGSLFSNSYTTVTLSDNSQIRFKVFTTYIGGIIALQKFSQLYSPAIKLLGDNFAIIDNEILFLHFSNRPLRDDNFNIESNVVSPLSDDGGIGETILDNGIIINTRAQCSRPWIPYTRQGSGIVHWQISNPRILHALKDENIDDPNPRRLRCPSKRTGTTDYYVDGVYNVLWFSSSSAKALKIPNHCSVVRNSIGWATCCYAPLIPYYGKVQFINPRDRVFPNWPDDPRICTNSEP